MFQNVICEKESRHRQEGDGRTYGIYPFKTPQSLCQIHKPDKKACKFIGFL